MILFVTLVVITVLLFVIAILLTVLNDIELNSSCTTQRDCGLDYVCLSGHCKAGIGIICSADTDCATGHCVSGICVGTQPATTVSNRGPTTVPSRAPTTVSNRAPTTVSNRAPTTVPSSTAASTTRSWCYLPTSTVQSSSYSPPDRTSTSTAVSLPLRPNVIEYSRSDMSSPRCDAPVSVPAPSVTAQSLPVRYSLPMTDLTNVSSPVLESFDYSPGHIRIRPSHQAPTRQYRKADTRESFSHEASTPVSIELYETVARPVPQAVPRPTTESVSRSMPPPGGVLDMCAYSQTVLTLASPTTIICDSSGIQRRCISNIPISRLVVYSGYLHALSNGEIYSIDASATTLPNWIFKPVAWSPKSVYHISTTLDGTSIWLQHGSGATLRSADGSTEHSLSQSIRRNYGMTTNSYIDINDTTRVGELHLSTGIVKSIPDILDAALTHADQLITLPVTGPHSRIRIVNWEPRSW
jgi:hypothetical protein